jgi:hypothetical protein
MLQRRADSSSHLANPSMRRLSVKRSFISPVHRPMLLVVEMGRILSTSSLLSSENYQPKPCRVDGSGG